MNARKNDDITRSGLGIGRLVCLIFAWLAVPCPPLAIMIAFSFEGPSLGLGEAIDSLRTPVFYIALLLIPIGAVCGLVALYFRPASWTRWAWWFLAGSPVLIDLWYVFSLIMMKLHLM